MPVTLIIVVTLIITLHASPGSASDNTLYISPTLYYFGYREYSQTNQLLNKETGFLPGIRFDYEHTEPEGTIDTHIAVFDGTIDYTGQTQSGTPHLTKTEEQLLNIGFRLAPKHNQNLPVSLFIGFQLWQWDRNILLNNNILGLHETYSWSELEAGLRTETKPDTQSLYWLEISTLYILNPNMAIHLATSIPKLNMEEEPGFRFRTGKTWNHKKNTHLSVNLLVEYWSFGRSNTIFVSDFFGRGAFITEPRSETINSGLEFTYVQKF